MRELCAILATAAFMGGVVLFAYAFALPSGYRLGDASAIQVSQVYNTGMFYGVLSIAAFVASVVLTIVANGSND